jgi:hypothetical protein
VGKHGNHRLPDLFYEGVTFGVTGENSHDFEVREVLHHFGMGF